MGTFNALDKDAAVQLMPIACETSAAFAVTLEKERGSTIPTLSVMYVLGNV